MDASIFRATLKSLDRLTFQRGDGELVDRYLNKGGDVNARDQQGWTPLMHAASKGHKDLCYLLLRHGADKTILDKSGLSVIEIATNEGHLDIAGCIEIFNVDPIPTEPEESKDELESEFFGAWLPEHDVLAPIDDQEVRHQVSEMQESISSHMVVDRDEDWSDIKLELPDTNGLDFLREIQRDDVQAMFVSLLGEVREHGIFKISQVEAIAREVENVTDGEFFRHLMQMLEDIGAIYEESEEEWLPRYLWGKFLGADESSDFHQQYLQDLSSRTNDPYTHLIKSIKRSVLLDREGEERIGKLIALALKDASRAIALDERAITILLGLEGDIRADSWLAGRMSRIDVERFEMESALPGSDEKDDEEYAGDEILLVERLISMLADVRSAWLEYSSFSLEEASLGNLVNAVDKIELSTFGIKKIQKKLIESGSDNLHLAVAVERISRLENEMFMANVRLAISIAEKYKWSKLPQMDRIQESFIGLLKAIEKFNFNKGYKFSTYATWWLKQAVTRAISDKARLIRLPVHVLDKANRLSKIARLAGLDSPRGMPIHVLSEASEYTEAEVRKALAVFDDATLWGDSQIDHSAVMDYEDDANDPSRYAEKLSVEKFIRACLEKLPERQAEIIMHRFGLVDGIEKTLEEVGQIFGLTRERIRQIEVKAMMKLRHPNMGLDQLNQLM